MHAAAEAEKVSSKPSPFGAAKPVDTRKKLQEVEAKLEPVPVTAPAIPAAATVAPPAAEKQTRCTVSPWCKGFCLSTWGRRLFLVDLAMLQAPRD